MHYSFLHRLVKLNLSRYTIYVRKKTSQKICYLTKHDRQSLGGFPLLLRRRLFPFLLTGFVHFVNGEPGGCCGLPLFFRIAGSEPR